MVITMPQLGETVTEGTIIHWYKAVGDEVAEDEALFEVSTDKVDSEVPSPATGVVREILVPEGATVAVGTALAVVGADGSPDDIASDPVAVAPDARPAAHSNAESPTAPTRAVAPSTGTEFGPGATVTRDDVARRLEARERPLRQPAAAATGTARDDRAPAGARDDVEPFTAIRRRTAEHMVRSLSTAAHTLIVMELDYSGIERARLPVRDAFRADEGFGLTYLPFVARAVLDAIAEYPRVNASVGNDELVVHRDVHLGVAVDLEFEGLVVPVIHDAGRLRLAALARAMHERADAARARVLAPDDVAGGTFTLTNAGGYGTLLTAPIISQPQVAIISTDGVTMRPVAIRLEDADAGYGIAVHPVGNLALSFDHRAFDGAYASAFLQRVVQIFETRDWSEELR
jgi:pyruvate dehydrogenase E2 component (dihydrolipoamide acetyltransferase)